MALEMGKPAPDHQSVLYAVHIDLTEFQLL
jgi:hypothetical protein